MENEWKRAIDAGTNVDVSINVFYEGDSLRPSNFVIDYTYNGVKQDRIIFDNTVGGGLE